MCLCRSPPYSQPREGRQKKGLELFLGQLGIGNCQELLIELRLRAKVAIAQNVIGKKRNLGSGREGSKDQQVAQKPSWK